MFRNAFGGGGRPQERRGQNMVADVEVDLESVYKGDEMTVSWAVGGGRRSAGHGALRRTRGGGQN